MQAVAFIETHGHRPTRKDCKSRSKDPEEKSLGIWLHRFTCNDDRVKDRVRAAMDDTEFNQLLRTIDEAPDAKQVCTRPFYSAASLARRWRVKVRARPPEYFTGGE